MCLLSPCVSVSNSLYPRRHVRTVVVTPQVPNPWPSEPQRTRPPRASQTAPTLPSSQSCSPFPTAGLGPGAKLLPGLSVERLRARNKEEGSDKSRRRDMEGSRGFIMLEAEPKDHQAAFCWLDWKQKGGQGVSKHLEWRQGGVKISQSIKYRTTNRVPRSLLNNSSALNSTNLKAK